MTQDNDDRFDGWLKDAARDYNRPPTNVPREEMWDVIAAARSSTAASDEAATRRRGPARWQVWGMAAAATLVLGVGFGAGRLSKSDHLPSAGGVAVIDSGAPAAPAAPGSPVGGGSATYQLATLRHLTDAEAMLTSFQNAPEAPNARMDASVQGWARELLTNTRLLLDSPAAEDAQRRHLLEDLELILVQIVQIHGGNAASDRALIDGTINRDQVMTRIRTAIPAGGISGP